MEGARRPVPWICLPCGWYGGRRRRLRDEVYCARRAVADAWDGVGECVGERGGDAEVSFMSAMIRVGEANSCQFGAAVDFAEYGG